MSDGSLKRLQSARDGSKGLAAQSGEQTCSVTKRESNNENDAGNEALSETNFPRIENHICAAPTSFACPK